MKSVDQEEYKWNGRVHSGRVCREWKDHYAPIKPNKHDPRSSLRSDAACANAFSSSPPGAHGDMHELQGTSGKTRKTPSGLSSYPLDQMRPNKINF